MTASKLDDSAVAIDTLVKRYPGAPANAVDELFLKVRPGEIFGLLVAGVDGVERVERVESASAVRGGPGGASRFGPPSPAVAPAMGETRFRLYLSHDPAAVLGPVAQLLAKRDCPITNVQIGEPSLEDVFITLTERSLR
ncbi:hypothetical protein AB0H88_18265 [Nonomuraea sp. NPDC050680]|uniref:hypothetical protein n=1 Tax=Nonomuraea sp. NPDC050680 TaxID=3154630 RepID=UPI00340BE71F